MAESKYKGLLYSPEVLGGIGLLTAGLSGASPDKALPSLMQGMQTASMFRKQEDEEEKRRFIKEYESQVPPDQLAAFKAFPQEWVKQNLFANKKPNFKTFVDLNSNKRLGFNLSNKDEFAALTKFRNDKNTNVIEAPSMDKTSDFAKNQKGLQDTVINNTNLLNNLNRQDIMFKDEFLSAKGKIKFEYLLKKDELASISGIELTQDERGFLNRRSSWLQLSQQYFNDYRKAVTGVAAGEKEIGWIQESIPSDKDTPATYRAKIKNQKIIQQKLIDNANLFLKTEGKAAMVDGEYTKEYLNYIKGKVTPSGEMIDNKMKAYKMDGYEPSVIIDLLEDEFKGFNWKNTFEIYQKAKGGSL
mgnify:FL=1